MGKQELKKEEKRIGAFIRYDNNTELGLKLEELAEYQEQNNIEKINKYYIQDFDGFGVLHYKAIADIFEENIDTLLVIGSVDDLWMDDKTIEKIMQNIELIEV